MMVSSIKWLKSENRTQIFLIVVLLIAAFLRLWGIWRLDLFTYDQARDATYIRRILVNREFPLIGPQSSIPGISLGPLYYYLMTLPLLIFNFNPIGIDLATAGAGVATVWLLFKFLETRTTPLVSLLTSLLYAVSPIVVEVSRRAWNPNMVPLFLLLIIYSLVEIVEKRQVFYFLLLASSLAIIIQLHYSALLTLLSVLVVFLIFRKGISIDRYCLLGGLLIFLFLISPLFIFNLRHNWLMARSAYRVLLGVIREEGTKVTIKLKNTVASIWHLFEGLLLPSLRPLSLAIFTFIFPATLWLLKKKTDFSFKLSLIFLIVGVVGAQFYPEGFSFFYYIFLFPIPFIIFAYLLEFILKTYPGQKLIIILFTAILSGWLFYQTGKIIFRPPVRVWRDFNLVADVVAKDPGADKRFNLVAIYKSPGRWENYYRRGIVREDIRWDHNAVDYGYFIELRGKRPLPWDNFQDAEVLYLIAETGVREPLKVEFWEIEQFGPKKVTGSWQLDNGTTIYKLER